MSFFTRIKEIIKMVFTKDLGDFIKKEEPAVVVQQEELVKEEKEEDRNYRILREGHCPKCGGSWNEFRVGPSGGMSTNYICGNCGTIYNLCIGFSAFGADEVGYDPEFDKRTKFKDNLDEIASKIANHDTDDVKEIASQIIEHEEGYFDAH